MTSGFSTNAEVILLQFEITGDRILNSEVELPNEAREDNIHLSPGQAEGYISFEGVENQLGNLLHAEAYSCALRERRVTESKLGATCILQPSFGLER